MAPAGVQTHFMHPNAISVLKAQNLPRIVIKDDPRKLSAFHLLRGGGHPMPSCHLLPLIQSPRHSNRRGDSNRYGILHPVSSFIGILMVDFSDFSKKFEKKLAQCRNKKAPDRGGSFIVFYSQELTRQAAGLRRRQTQDPHRRYRNEGSH